jgi:hypothetical protein
VPAHNYLRLNSDVHNIQFNPSSGITERKLSVGNSLETERKQINLFVTLSVSSSAPSAIAMEWNVSFFVIPVTFGELGDAWVGAADP